MNAPLMFSSDNQRWQTPRVVLDLVREMGPIALDPSADLDAPFAVVNYAGKAHNFFSGLEESWRGHGLVYCNPPYGRALEQWAKKAHWEFVKQAFFPATMNFERDELVLLVPARPDTRWWQRYITRAAAICFWTGRITFVGAKHAAPFPSALVYFGYRPERFVEVFKKRGWCLRLVERANTRTSSESQEP